VLRRTLQATLLVAYVILVSTWLWLGEAPSIQPLGRSGLSYAVGMILWWSSPALTLFFLQTWAGALFTGIALLLAGSVAFTSVYSSVHSTAEIGLIVLPTLLWLIALFSVAGDWALRRPWSL